VGIKRGKSEKEIKAVHKYEVTFRTKGPSMISSIPEDHSQATTKHRHQFSDPQTLIVSIAIRTKMCACFKSASSLI